MSDYSNKLEKMKELKGRIIKSGISERMLEEYVEVSKWIDEANEAI